MTMTDHRVPEPEYGPDVAMPRIYVASLSDYNAGRLHGEWIDAAQTADEIQAEVQAMLARSPEAGAEEWAIHDYEGFGLLSIGEWDSFETVAELARLIDEYGMAYSAFAEYVGTEYADESSFQDAYQGQWDSQWDFAENLFDDVYLHEVPESIQSYIDYGRFARDLFMGDYWSADSASGVYVFSAS